MLNVDLASYWSTQGAWGWSMRSTGDLRRGTGKELRMRGMASVLRKIAKGTKDIEGTGLKNQRPSQEVLVMVTPANLWWTAPMGRSQCPLKKPTGWNAVLCFRSFNTAGSWYHGTCHNGHLQASLLRCGPTWVSMIGRWHSLLCVKSLWTRRGVASYQSVKCRRGVLSMTIWTCEVLWRFDIRKFTSHTCFRELLVLRDDLSWCLKHGIGVIL